MGLRSSIVVCVTSFLIGALSTNWIADSLTLWQSPVTEPHLKTAASYYTLVSKTPSGMSYVLIAIVLIGALSILSSIWDGRAGNLMFDGASLFLFASAAAVYLFSVLPNLLEFSPIPLTALTSHLSDSIPTALRRPTLELASSHLVCSVALTGVLALQAGRRWAEGEDQEDESADSLSALLSETPRRTTPSHVENDQNPSEEPDTPPPGARGRRRSSDLSSENGGNRPVVWPSSPSGHASSLRRKGTAERRRRRNSNKLQPA